MATQTGEGQAYKFFEMICRFSITLVAILLSICTTASASELDSNWWIILANFKICGSEACNSREHRAQIERQAQKCQLKIFNDFSMKFSGFSPGYEVYVVDEIFTLAKAQRALKNIKKCFPEAYIKYGDYSGE